MITTPVPPRGFPDSEFAARTQRAQKLMSEAALDALLVLTEPDVRYFTGFLTPFWQSPTRPWFVIVPASGKPVAVIPTIGAECMARTWVDDIRTWPAPVPADEGVSLLADTLIEVTGGSGRVGLPMGPETALRMSLNDFNKLSKLIDPLQFVDASPVMQPLRMIKSEPEIDKVRYICGVMSGVFEGLPDHLSMGMSEVEIFKTFKSLSLEAGADDVAFLVGGLGEGGYADIISPPSARQSRPGDILILDTGATFDGYFCDFDRNYAFGEPDDAAKRAHDVVYRATEAGLATARPGVTCAELFGAMQRVMDEGGAMGNDVGRLGHGLGMQLTEWPSNMPSDMTVLEPGMVITLEPGMTFAEGKVMVHEENIVIRDGAPELLSRRAPADMPVIG
ncbi:MAG: aminopeptidase P family protein [Rhodospirillales bacterium]|nr:aminopeptidase P family protein [Rhodospirillales bacterium]MBO6786724.1 aminopeptidase P family protein [Rhodospirillales bacterium]